MPWDVAVRLLQQGLQSGSRSSVVTVLGWMALTLASCMIATVTFHAPGWMQIFVATMLGMDFLTFIGVYVGFALTNPDALRSEKYSIQKMAIQHHLMGDSESGLFDLEGAGITQIGQKISGLVEREK